MEDYPASYVARPRPLLVLSGFDVGDDGTSSLELLKNGPSISSDSPVISGEHGKNLLKDFLALDSNGLKDVAQPAINLQFRIKAVGRVKKTAIVDDDSN